MRDPDLVFRAQRAASALERAWQRWRIVHGQTADPTPVVSSYVGYSLEDPWGQPRVVLGLAAQDAEQLVVLLDRHQCVGPVHALVGGRPAGGLPAGGLLAGEDEQAPAIAIQAQLALAGRSAGGDDRDGPVFRQVAAAAKEAAAARGADVILTGLRLAPAAPDDLEPTAEPAGASEGVGDASHGDEAGTRESTDARHAQEEQEDTDEWDAESGEEDDDGAYEDEPYEDDEYASQDPAGTLPDARPGDDRQDDRGEQDGHPARSDREGDQQSGHPAGYDAAGHDAAGHEVPGSSAVGYDAAGYDAAGYDAAGYDVPGYDAASYDVPGYDAASYDDPGSTAVGYGAPGSGSVGYDVPGTSAVGYDVPGTSVVGDEPVGGEPVGSDALAHDALGYDALAHDALGYDALAHDALGYDALGYDALGYDALGHDAAEATGVLARFGRPYESGPGADSAETGDLGAERGERHRGEPGPLALAASAAQVEAEARIRAALLDDQWSDEPDYPYSGGSFDVTDPDLEAGRDDGWEAAPENTYAEPGYHGSGRHAAAGPRRRGRGEQAARPEAAAGARHRLARVPDPSYLDEEAEHDGPDEQVQEPQDHQGPGYARRNRITRGYSIPRLSRTKRSGVTPGA